MKKFFGFVQDSATIVFLVGFATYFLWQEVGVRFSRDAMVLAFQFMAMSAPLIVVTTLVRWTYKWPTTVSWFTLAFAMTATVGFIYSVRALMIIFGSDNSPLMVKVILPALVPLLSAIAMWAAIKWYRDRSHQSPAK